MSSNSDGRSLYYANSVGSETQKVITGMKTVPGISDLYEIGISAAYCEWAGEDCQLQAGRKNITWKI